MSGDGEVTIALTLTKRAADLLGALVDPEWGHTGLESVVAQLVDHAQQGVYRPGAWERDWLCRAFGYDWTERMEPDPDLVTVDGRMPFERRKVAPDV